MPVPPDILKLHKSVTIAADLMFVNKVPFLVTTSRKIYFGTVEVLPERKLNTIVTNYDLCSTPITIVDFQSPAFLLMVNLSPSDPGFLR